jgi:hypothetical protein
LFDAFYSQRHLQDASNKLVFVLFVIKLLEKVNEKLKKLNFWVIFSVFEAEEQLGALKILKSRKTKVVLN